MNLPHAVGRFVCDRLVNLSPGSFMDSLRKNHYEFVAREFNRPFLFDWRQASIPSRVEEFEDLIPMFGLSPMNRGIIRQDFDEAAALFQAVRSLPNPRGIEIGRFNGGSTILLAAAVGPQGRITSIDIEPQNDSVLNDMLDKTGLKSRVKLIIGDANLVEPEGQYDFVFIDGDHSYEGARRDHNRWGRLTRAGGLIIHHDMANSRALATQWSDLARLRSDILSRQQAELELVEEAGSMAIFRRRHGVWTDV